MDWFGWVQEVLRLAHARGIPATVTFDAPGFATFHWECPHGVDYRGTAGAGASLIRLTTPAQFVQYWYCPPAPRQAPTLNTPVETGPQLEAWERRGVFVPRVPARAVALALEKMTL